MTDEQKTREQLLTELAQLRQRIEESEAAETAARDARQYAENIVETVREPLVVLDADLRVISANPSFYRTFQVRSEESEGRLIYDLGNRQWDIPALRELLEEIIPQNTTFEDYEVEHDFASIGQKAMLLNARRIYVEASKTQMILLAIEDITERKRAREALAQEILDISTPVIQVWEGVVVAPLIGTLDSQRTERFMERLLERIVETRSRVALVDITGVATIDTQTAQHLIDTVTAVRLLGAQVMLTGVSPAIAVTLVHLGIDLSGLITRASLMAGLRLTMELLGLQMVTKNENVTSGSS